MNSLAAAVIAMSIVVTAEVNKKTQDLWFLDSAVGLVVSLFLLAYGGWLVGFNIVVVIVRVFKVTKSTCVN